MEVIKSRLGLDNNNFFAGVVDAVKKVDHLKTEVKKTSGIIDEFAKKKATKEIGIKNSVKSDLKTIVSDTKKAFDDIKKTADNTNKTLNHLVINPKVDFKSFKNIADTQIKQNIGEIIIPANIKLQQLKSAAKGLINAPKNFVMDIKTKFDNSSLVRKIGQTKAQASSLFNRLKKSAYLKIAPMVVLKDMATPKVKNISSRLKTLATKPIRAAVGIKDNISGKINQLRSKLKPLNSKFTAALSIKDGISSKLSSIRGKLSSMGRMVMKPSVLIKDNTAKVMSGLKSIAGRLTSLPALATAALAGLGVKDVLQSGMKLEQQKISIEHFMGVGNKDKDLDTIKKMSDEYVDYLRQNANLTPFAADEVIAAGTRSLTISGGDLTAAKGMLKLAENMAALNPNKSLMDAMEALADLNVGETERMKEFGFKISQDDIKNMGMDKIMSDIDDQFKDGAEKLSKSATGVWNTVKGKFGSAKTDIGMKMLEGAKPALEKFSGWLTDNQDKIGAFSEKVGIGFSKAVGFISEHAPKAKQAIDIIKDGVGILGDKVGGVIDWFSAWKDRSGETIEGVKANFLDLLNSCSGVIDSFKGMIDGFVVFWENNGDNMIEALTSTLNLASDIVGAGLDLISGIFQTVGDILRGDWEAVWDDLTSIATNFWNNLMGIFEKGKEWIGSIFDLFTGEKKNKSASGTGNGGGATRTISNPKASFAVGIKRLPEDMIAQVHKDEAIIPAKYNPWNPSHSLEEKTTPLSVLTINTDANFTVKEKNNNTENAINMSNSGRGISVNIGTLKIDIPVQQNGEIDFEQLKSQTTKAVLEAIVTACENMSGVQPL